MESLSDRLYEIVCKIFPWSFPVIGLMLGLIVMRLLTRTIE